MERCDTWMEVAGRLVSSSWIRSFLRTTDVADLGLMNFILLIYRICWAIILSHITAIECFSRLWAPSLIQFDLLTQASSVLVLEMRWRLIRFGYSWSLNSNQCILFIISLAACSRWELACVAFPSSDRPQQKQALGKCVGQIEKACSSTPERRCVAFCTSNNIKHQGFIYHPTERRTAKEEICGIRPSAEKIYMVNCGILPVHTCPPVA